MRLYNLGRHSLSSEISMNQFINHIDHVAWLCHLKNLDEYARRLSALSSTTMIPHIRKDLGLSVYMSWQGGLEIVAPLDDVDNEFNAPLRARLKERGEGVFAVVLGVKNLDEAVSRARREGYVPGDILLAGDSITGAMPPWNDQHSVMRESIVGDFMNSLFAYGEVVYAEGVILTADAQG
jgi:hypothetical protein